MELVARFFKALIKPITGLLALFTAKKYGALEYEKKALEEHIAKVKKANAARIAGELSGLHDEDYRD